MRTPFSVFLTVILALGLTGCRTFWDPTFMPAGTTYHQEPYKAPPGPDADDIGYDYSAEANEGALEAWRVVVKDLVDQISEQLGATAQGIYVEPLPHKNAFNASYDHILREELAARGYVLATNVKGAILLWYEGHVPKYVVNPGSLSKQGEGQGHDYKEFVLILTAMNKNVRIAKAAGMYKLPPYDFTEAGGINFKRYQYHDEDNR